jgi:hypothetical protein
MKNDRVFLAEWLGDYSDGYIDIPWPMVHEWVGYDVIRWLNSHSHEKVQLILEKDPGDCCIQRLYAEFYLDSLRSEFALRFAK